MLLSRDFTIKAVTRSYAASAGRCPTDLLHQNVFDAFPKNPCAPEGGRTEDFADMCERVLRFRRSQQLAPLRYDVRDAGSGEFVEKQWAVAIDPVCVDGVVTGVMVCVQDVTDLLQDQASGVDSAPDLVASYRALATEAGQLRRALQTRPTIDLAKGVLMADRGCTEDEAFSFLRKLSMDTNVPVAQVAAAIVYQAESHSRR